MHLPSPRVNQIATAYAPFMPDRFVAICPKCGPVKVWPVNVTIETIVQQYRFECPECSAETVNDATPTDTIRLLRGGAQARP